MMKILENGMIGIVRDVAGAVLILGGVVVTVVAAEASLPVVAGLGALTAVGTGMYQAISSPKRPHAPKEL
jgi:hypothetical protein